YNTDWKQLLSFPSDPYSAGVIPNVWSAYSKQKRRWPAGATTSLEFNSGTARYILPFGWLPGFFKGSDAVILLEYTMAAVSRSGSAVQAGRWLSSKLPADLSNVAALRAGTSFGGS